MSDQKKEGGGPKQGRTFGGGNNENIRDLIPTEAEGDALLDMLFDDAPAQGSDRGARDSENGPSDSETPGQEEDQPTRVHAAGEVEALLESVRSPKAAEPPRQPGPPRAPPRLDRTPTASARVDRSRVPTLPGDEVQATSLEALDAGDPEEALTEIGSLQVEDVLQATSAEVDSSDVSELDYGDEDAIDATEAPPRSEAEVRAAAESFGDESFADERSAPAPIAGPTVDGGERRLSSRAPAAPDAVPSFPDERDASVVVAQNPELRRTFVERAAWIRAEAGLAEDKSEKARLLLTASELYAMVGEDDDASAVALEAHALNAGVVLAMRQHRSLLARSGNWPAALEVLDAEARIMPTTDGKVHAAWFGAEVARLAQGDDLGSKKRSEQAMRAMPSDPRPHVQRFADALASGAESAQLTRLRPTEPSAAELADAFTRVAGMHGDGRTGDARSAYESVLAARAALQKKDLVGAVASINGLGSSTIAAGAGWLGGLFAQSTKETRSLAASLLTMASAGTHSNAASRSLAGLAIQTGTEADLSVAPDAFTEADRVALAALAGGDGFEESAIAGEREIEVLRSVTRAAMLARDGERITKLDETGIDPPTVALGRALAQASTPAALGTTTIPSKVHRAAESLESEMRPSGHLRGLLLELDVDRGGAAAIASTLLGGDASEADTASSIAAAIVSEIGGDADEASVHYARALEQHPFAESLLRASAGAASTTAAEIGRSLKKSADMVSTGARKMSLLVEAGIRLTEEDASEAAASFRGAAEAEPTQSLPGYLGARLARASADQEALLDWLRVQREASNDPTERAYDLAREALLVSDSEGATASALIEEALRAHPRDMGLRDLYERILPEPATDRATWREARAKEEKGPTAARLAIEAAIDYEQQGDLESAARAAKLAATIGDTEFAPICANRYALGGFGTAELIDALLPQAREAATPEERLELYERLAELDERGRNDMSSALLFRRTILEENPQHMRTLRRVVSALMAQGREEELEPVALDLAKILEGPEAHAYAALANRLRSRTKWEEGFEAVKVAFAQEPRSAWALRQMAAHARNLGNHALAGSCDKELMTRTDRPAERATLAIRAAESFVSAGDIDAAKELYEIAVGGLPGHPIGHIGFAELLEKSGEFEAAAQQFEAAADAMVNKAWAAEVSYRAGILRDDKLGDVEAAQKAFERVFVADPNNEDVFARLRKIYVARGARAELAELLERRLDSVQDPAERVEMEVMRGKALAEVGDAGAAKRALLAALESNPDHIDALSAFAELCVADEDYEGAEQALIRLARLTTNPDQQCEIYLRLGSLYDEQIPNPDRAELAYQEVLKRRPSDESARERLVALLRRTQNFPRAVEEQNALVEAAGSPEDKCKRTVELAEILEEMGDAKKAEASLVAARKSYPKSDVALRALVQFYQRTGQGPSASVMLDRAVADARRALSTGRFEPYLFETLWTAAELRGRDDAAAIARATVLALEGQETALAGAGLAAGDPQIDDMLAPEVMTPAFRELLLKTGSLLDQVVPFNFDAIRATPFDEPGELADELDQMTNAYGLSELKVMVSPVLGAVCIPVSSHPPTIVFGQNLAGAGSTLVRTFLIHRALKVVQTNCAALARTAPIDLWPLLAAYLKVLSPSFAPQGVDAGKFQEATARFAKLPKPAGAADLGVLASEVIGSIGNRASTLNTAVNGWGARAALLAVADPNVALSAIALASGAMNGPPLDGKDRVTWVGRNAEARDLIVYSVSDAYSDARARLGL